MLESDKAHIKELELQLKLKNDENRKLSRYCQEAHHQAAIHAAAAVALMKMLGEETLAKSKFVMPSAQKIKDMATTRYMETLDDKT